MAKLIKVNVTAINGSTLASTVSKDINADRILDLETNGSGTDIIYDEKNNGRTTATKLTVTEARDAIRQKANDPQSNVLLNATAGDITMVIEPETVAPAPTSSAWTRTVKVSFVDADGEVHSWLNETFAATLSIADTSTAGTASIDSTSLVVTNGVASIIVSGDAADWLDTETDTLTVADVEVLGYTVTGGTSVETFTA